MRSITGALAVRKMVGDVLVIRKEYEILEKELEKAVHNGCPSIVVTGQPGIGSYETLVHV